MSDVVHIDARLAGRLVAAQFPQWGDLTIKPVAHSGWDNRTFHLGEHMLLRFPSADFYAPKVVLEQRWLPHFAPLLPLKIPAPLAMGKPSHDYPFHWSIYKWIDGESAAVGHISDLSEFARTLAHFLKVFERIDTAGGLAAGPHNFCRGGSLKVAASSRGITYDGEVRRALEILVDAIDVKSAEAAWNKALESTWQRPGVWVHGDVAPGNLLVDKGKLIAVIDFGCMGIGDPACDFVIAWTLFKGESRKVFRAALGVDDATWERARGWALWKALIVCAGLCETHAYEKKQASYVLNEVITDYISENH
jgi:aminoglycoside phosphotransferase (APT) family kinase protein